MDRATAIEAFTPAAHMAARAFSIEPDTIELISLSENVTFRITARTNGSAYVLRLHRPGYHTLQQLNSELLWTGALADRGISVPVPIETKDGQYYVSAQVFGTTQHRYAGITRWIKGEVLRTMQARSDPDGKDAYWFGSLGEIMAVMHNQSSSWRPPQTFHRHALDADSLVGEVPFCGPFWEHPGLSAREQQLILGARVKIREALLRYGRHSTTFGVIHADMHPGNLIIDRDRLTVIDFDDTAFGWYLYDIAVALGRGQGKSNNATIEREFVRGYRAHRLLTDQALALIPMFRLVRGMLQIGWLNQRPEINATLRFKALREWVCEQCVSFETPC